MGNHQKKKNHAIRFLALSAVILFLFLALFIAAQIILKPKDYDMREDLVAVNGFGGMKDETVHYPDGDTFFRPGTDAIRYDEEAYALYFDRMLMVYLKEALTPEEAEALADIVDGEIVGRGTGAVSFLQLQVPPCGFSDLEDMAESLRKEDAVFFASYDYPVSLDAAELQGEDQNPWGGKAACPYDESAPSGKNWWAEAIGAYTAWTYSDQCGDYRIGIVDNGFYLEHEDLAGHIQTLEGYSCGTEEHGTHVAGIMGAADNGVGIRGVADGAELIVADWTAVSSYDHKSNYLASGEVLVLIQEMVEQGARVINNSWGAPISSKGKYRQVVCDGNIVGEALSYVPGVSHSYNERYSDYLETCKENARLTAICSMVLCADLMDSGKTEFLFVMSSGNGYDNVGTEGYDTELNSYFSSMSEEFYDKYLAPCDYSYEEIRDHVLIVASVLDKQDKNGHYVVDAGSNYGRNVDIWAPGKNIFSTVPGTKWAGVAVNGEMVARYSKYKELSGSSMAAPMVSASAAMLWAIEPSLDVGQVRDYLVENAGDAYNAPGRNAPVPMLNVGRAVQALINEKSIQPVGGAPEEVEPDEKPEEKETPVSPEHGTDPVLASSSPDTSPGVYRMGKIAEGDNALFYCDSIPEGTIYRLGEGESEPKPFLAKNEEGHELFGVMATEQYLYVSRGITGFSYIESYTFDGKKVGTMAYDTIKKLTDGTLGTVYFEGGYLYFGHDYTDLYRVEAVDGAEPEMVVDMPDHNVNHGFTVADGSLYYLDDGYDLIRCNLDGCEPEVLAELSPFSPYDIKNIYNGRIAYPDGDVICSWNLATLEETPLTLAVENEYGESSGGYLVGDVYIYKRYSYTTGEETLYGYNLHTGANRVLVSVDSQNNNLTPLEVFGGSKLYYRLQSWNEEDYCWEESIWSVELDGSDRKMLPLESYFYL